MLYIMSGIPGSGKSTYAREVVDQNIKWTKKSATILTPDEFRFVLTGKEFHAPAEDMVWATVKTTAKVLLNTDQDVIIDATALTKHRRSEWVHIAKTYGVWCYAIAMITPLEMCKENNFKRDRAVPKDVLNRQISQYTIPTVAEGFATIDLVTIDSGGSFKIVGYANPDVLYGEYHSELAKKPFYNMEK